MINKKVGIDIGATKTRVGLVQDAQVIREAEYKTSSNASEQEILEELTDGIIKVAGSDFSGIGVGVPGLMDEESGVLFDLLNIPSLKEVHLKEYLENFFSKPVYVTNDANIFALGEKVYGAGKPFKNFVGVTLGSGFGCGLIINGQLYSGAFSSAGEFGNLDYRDKTIEDYCSGKFFQQQYSVSGNEIYERALKGDLAAHKILEEYGENLGYALKLILNVVSPEAILLGGSVSKSFDYFKSSLQESMNSFPFKKVREQLVILPSTTSNIAILGSAALTMVDQQDLVS